MKSTQKTVTLRVPFSEELTFNITGSDKDESIIRMIQSNNGFYEPEIALLFSNIVKDDSICIDVGANIGAISVMMAALAKKGEVHSFEPIPENFHYLETNIKDSNLMNCRLNNIGLFSTEKTLRFHYIEEFAGGAFYSPIGVSDPRERLVDVQCITFDSYVEKNGLQNVDVIKIDVEGAEGDVLIGAEKTLRKYHPDLIVEFNPPASEKFFGKDMRGVYDQICNLGYQVNFLVRAGGKLFPTLSYDDLLTRIQNQGNIGDIYCTTRRT